MTSPTRAIEELLSEHGPLSTDDVIARLRTNGIREDAAAIQHQLDFDCPAVQLLDERWVWLPAIVAGRVFTHHVTADELAHDVLAVTPDLDPVAELCNYVDYQHLADGAQVSVAMAGFDDDLLDERGIPPEVVDEVGVLLLPPGALSALGVSAGDLVALRLTEAGLAVERVAAAQASGAVGDRLVATLAPGDMTSLDEAVWGVCLDDPTAFTRPIVPLNEVIAERGLVRHLDSVALPGFDVARWRFDLRCRGLMLRYDLESADAASLHTLITLCRMYEEGTSPALELLGAAGALMSDPYLAYLLRMETLESGVSPMAVVAFAEMLESRAPRSARVAGRWLRAVALERLGEVETAERELLAAESMDTEWPPTLLDLARFASDRGDAERGLALLRRADAPEDHPLFHMLESHRAMPRTDVGRNDACWCGSGRKYKKCHLGRDVLPLDDRTNWLYFKACQYVLGTPWIELLDDVTEIRVAHADDEDEAEELADDPFAIDATLFEGGAFEDFLATRGVLLPDDERSLAEQWLLVERSLFEVEQVQPGRSMRLRDVRTGDVHDVSERLGSRQLKPGHLICARVVPAGSQLQIFGGIEPVALQYRNGLIDLLDSEPDAEELVAFLSLRFAPPTIVNTEGDPVKICEATLRFADGIEAALDGAFQRVDGEETSWIETVVTDGKNRISATLALDGETVVAETNSERRLDAILGKLRELDPSMTVLDDVRREVTKADLGAPPKTTDPELVAALADFVRQYEDEWLDTSIPALDGLTPRQAADDPTRRADLTALLDGFPVLDGGQGMDPERLRAALGLS